jgi:transcriptional regulator with XRE-family HTH domain
MLTNPLLEKEDNHHPGDVNPQVESAGPVVGDMVGTKIRAIRTRYHMSLRKLAARSGLNINTLSLVENGKSSPSVSTLQHVATALKVPITAFFESEPEPKRVVFMRHNQRPHATFESAQIENLGKDLAENAVQPFMVILARWGGSGSRLIVHTGHEFVYCLSGKVLYLIDDIGYELEPGDSVVFESHLPHRWENLDEGESKMILVIYPADQREQPGGHHFQ